MATKSSRSSFVNQRFVVSDTVRLSISHWENKGGQVVYAVALLRKQVRGWRVDGDTAAEFLGADADYRATDYGARLVALVLGECPSRFFRDAASA